MSDMLLEDISRERTLPSEGHAVRTLPPVLKTFDLTTIFIVVLFTSPVIMSAMFAGAATFTYWVFATIVYLVPCVIATAQLGFLHPNEGALYNWTHKAFGGYWCFFVSFCTWIPCILVMVSGASVIVGYVQSLNPDWHWLDQPWQQGLAIIVILCVCAAFSLQRFRTVQNFVNLVVIFLSAGVLIVGVSGVVWLLKGHAPTTDYTHVSSWFMTFGDAKNPSNIAAFGIAVYSLLGMEAPLNMGAEIVDLRAEKRKRRRIILRHLFWGTALVGIGYLIDAFGVLTVVGGKSANGDIFAFVRTADTALGTGWGDVVALCIISFFLVEIVVYNYAYARLVFCSGIDQRLPRRIAKVNRNRVPINAIVIQTIVAAAFTAVTFVMIPYFQASQAEAEKLANIVYNVAQGAATVLWTASTAALFINVSVIYFRDKLFVLRNLIFPRWVLFVSVVVGALASIAAILDTLYYSWIPGLVIDAQWRSIVGSITLICLIIAGIGSMFANSQAEWEKFEQITKDQPNQVQQQLSSTLSGTP